MSTPTLVPGQRDTNHIYVPGRARNQRNEFAFPFATIALLSILLIGLLLAGCSTGGYAGGGVTGFSSASSFSIDAGQSYALVATVVDNTNIAWNLTGTSCSGSTCGTITTTSTDDATYTAPSVSSSMGVTATASVPNTTDSKSTTITVNPDPTITGTLPAGVVGSSYSSKLNTAGGTAPLTLSISSGSLPPGLTFNPSTGAITGSPLTPGTYSFTAQLVDSSITPDKVTASETIVVTAAALTMTTTTLPNGTVDVPYTGTIGVTGGIGPYTCIITHGALPAGLVLNGCTVTGTPTTPGSSTVTVQVNDSENPAMTTTGPQTIVINPAPLKLTSSTLPNGTVNVPYSATVGVVGGTAPYKCVLAGGTTAPQGLTLNSNCTVTGTPTKSGQTNFQVMVTDSSPTPNTVTGPESITIAPAGSLTLTASTLPNGTVNIAYNATVGVTGGTAPYMCVLANGTSAPMGLTLNSNCTVTGTPTKSGTTTFQVTATDSATTPNTVTGPETITIEPSGALSLTGTMPNGIVNVAYNYTLTATGGTQPYNYTITAGSLPNGITMSTSGVFTGTPTAPGASSFTVTVTDSSAPQQTASLALVLLVTYPIGPNDGELKGPYAYLFQGYDDVVAGVLAYKTATVGSFTSNGAGVLSAGELDANHQSSTSTGTTVADQSFVGTYIVNADNTGFITITTLNTDGTTNATTTYAITLKPPVTPSTISAEGSLIEYDDAQLVGTRGSGMLMAQTSAAVTAGLKGNYAFGLSGDTPCLVSCTLGLLTGPAATVGVFDASGGDITAGTSDTNIAATNYAQAPLTGSYMAPDANGRVQMTLSNTTVTDGEYPVDYVAYVVNANEVLMMSTDIHSSYILLAGTAQLQQQTSYSNASLNGAFIGYENSQSDPGLVGATLQGVLSFDTATIFRASGDGSGSCDTTNVDEAGLTGLVDSLTGLGNQTQLLQALLGNYATTGNANCQVSGNGRAVLEYPSSSGLISSLLGDLGLGTAAPAPRVAYLYAPGTGYFLETSYAGIGNIEAQTGAPYSLGTLDGTYIESTIPASTLASINSEGTFTANGTGTITYSQDENVGVGNINILELGQTGTYNYTLNDPNNTVSPETAGRYLLSDGVTVIYAITPSRFVLLNTSALQTAPTISLVY